MGTHEGAKGTESCRRRKSPVSIFAHRLDNNADCDSIKKSKRNENNKMSGGGGCEGRPKNNAMGLSGGIEKIQLNGKGVHGDK